MRVLAAMSGGVDSGVAAALLAERGADVIGVTLKLFCYSGAALSPRACCTLEAIDDARRVAQRMGFPHFVVDAEEVFRTRVLQPFVEDYVAGRTPYPCAACNQHLKFGDLLARLELVGADTLATGHYTRITRDPAGEPALCRARDPRKDQSYALALIPRAALARVEFPLGALDKDEVRAHGRRLGLSLWDKPESQDLCFVPDRDYAGFVRNTLGETRGTAPGAIEDARGRRLGTHQGVMRYTVGQRKGLGLAAPEPLYVLAVDAVRNVVTVGGRAALESPGLVTRAVNWLVPTPPEDGARIDVKIRYHHEPAPATLHAREGGAVEVRFDAPQSAVTPGQLAVFYDGDRVLGGAPIAHALDAAPAPAAAPAPEAV
ncbi:MAG TPA: tRNA 2-thiouridine(34) synthase MnmA, partial [Candidatus Eisenbacteria bacterium]|nr:tRNA 2-thiouridine(34) synthase MnmA [Candidatus Eisenbacteria bacterium]